MIARVTARSSARIAAAGALALAAGAAEAGGGFSVRTQSVATLGMAQAGMTTGVGGLATMIYNPATLSAASGRSVETATGFVLSAGDFDDVEARNLFGGPIAGGDGGRKHEPGLLPGLFLGADLTETVRVGLAATSLYGLSTHYDDDWSGRYQALDSELISLTVQPTVSWRATPWLALGAGVLIQYVHSRSTVAIDFGSIDAALTGGAFGGAPGQDDGELEATLDGFGAGFSVGALASPTPRTRIGFGFRSPINQSLDGDAEFDLGGPVGAGLSAATGAFTSTGVGSEVDLPASVFFGVRQEVGSGVTLYADLNWMGWGRIDALTLDFDNPAQERGVTSLPWDDAIYVAFGGSWEVDRRLTLRAGAAFDQGPARDGGATASIPDGNSIWAASGLSYRMTDSILVDAALGAVFTEDVRVRARASDPGGTFRGDFSGRYEDGRAYFGGLAMRIAF